VSTGRYGDVVDLSHTRDAAATDAAMHAGAGVIFQAPLVLNFPEGGADGSKDPAGGPLGFKGVADFLVKVPLPPPAGPAPAAAHGFGSSYTYQVWDAKLAKRPAPSHVLQLCCYTDMVANLAAKAVAEAAAANKVSLAAAGSARGHEEALHPRAVLVLDAASTPTSVDLAPYGAFYRAAVSKHLSRAPSWGPGLVDSSWVVHGLPKSNC
jgi:hypothetical protein